ncbi:MAG: Gfo/Idh/MocA family oxidoreductase [Caulobacteraceae bacterium]|nr:Gfo/Idh/MocA family oxidoreductase [Caulobacter sp.]
MTLRLGLLGASRIAPKAVIDPALGRDDVAVAAVAARDLGKAQAYAAEHAIPAAVEGYAALLARDDVDAVYSALPPAEHLEWARAAAEAGKAQLVEKPFAANAAQAQAMVAAAGAAGRPLLEAFHYRFHPAFLTLKHWVADGRLGRLRRASATFDAEIAERPGELRWIRPLGGGALMDLGCYALHALRTLLDAEPQVVEARCDVRSGVDAATRARLAFGEVEATLACDMTRPRSARLVLEGDRGRAEFDNYVSPHAFGCLTFTAADGTAQEAPRDPRPTYAFQLDQLVEVCAGRAAPLTGGLDAVDQMRAIDAIYAAGGLGPIG